MPEVRHLNQCSGEIVEIGDLLGRHRVAVRLGGTDEVLQTMVEPESLRLLGLEVGVAVVAMFEPSCVRWVL